MSDLDRWVPTRNETLFNASIAIVTLSFVVVLLRFISRIWTRRWLSPDDWLILLAWVLALGLSVALCIGEDHGLGSHKPEEKDNGVGDLGTVRKARFTFVLLYILSLVATKMSILFFYLSLFGNFTHLKRCIWITMLAVGIGGVVLTLLIFFQCHPVSAAFSTRYTPPPKATCLNTITILYAAAPWNIITDLAILLLPMPALTSLKLPKREKIIVIMLFAGGGFVTVVGVVRIYYLDRAVLSGSLYWDGSLSFMWSAIEVNVSIICASIPMLKPLVVFLIPGFLGLSGQVPSNERNYEHGRRDLNSTSTYTNDHTIPIQSDDDTPNIYTSQGAPNISPVGAPIRQVWKPLGLATILFFLWGFVYGLLCVLRNQFQVHYDLSIPQSLGLQAAYFGPYFFTPRVFSGAILKKYGFKATFISGLLIYTCSTLIYWPAVILGSLPGYIVADIFAGFGAATLETAANPYVALVGPLGMGESRLNIAQGFQAVGNLCASLLQYRQTFSKLPGTPTREVADMNWAFLAIVFFMTSLAVVFYYFELPELKDSEFPTLQTCETDDLWRSKCSIGPILAAVSIFLYVGAQETITVFWDNYFEDIGITTRTGKPTLEWELLGTGIFAVGRFVASIALLWLCPRVVLLGSVVGCAITLGLAATRTGRSAASLLVVNRLLQSSIFPTLFSIGLRGLGRHTKTISVYLVTGISGGAILPGIYYAVAKQHGYRFAMCVPTIYFCLCIILPLYCYISSDQRYRFGFIIRGDTTDQFKNVPSMALEVYQYVRKGLGPKYLDPDECVERIV